MYTYSRKVFVPLTLSFGSRVLHDGRDKPTVFNVAVCVGKLLQKLDHFLVFGLFCVRGCDFADDACQLSKADLAVACPVVDLESVLEFCVLLRGLLHLARHQVEELSEVNDAISIDIN